MSRRYDMCVRVPNVRTQEDAETVAEFIEREWTTEWSDLYEEEAWTLRIGGEGYLCGGESEEEWAHRISTGVWGTLGYFVPVDILATYLEELPCESYVADEDQYEKWNAENGGVYEDPGS